MSVVLHGQIGLGITSDKMTALDFLASSNIWPGTFSYLTPLDRILAEPVLAGLFRRRRRISVDVELEA